MSFSKPHKVILLFIFLVAFRSVASAAGEPRMIKTNDDSLKRIMNRDARRAALLSAVVPGLGQAYNKKFWKIPIIYAALGGIGYFALQNNQLYQGYHKELLFRYNHGDTLKSNYPNYTTDNLITLKNQYKKYRDMFFIGVGIVYLLNIADASVDAHLKKFDVSDNLSLTIRPRAFYCARATYSLGAGISISLNFK